MEEYEKTLIKLQEFEQYLKDEIEKFKKMIDKLEGKNESDTEN